VSEPERPPPATRPNAPSRAFWGGLLALTVALVVVGGLLAGSAIGTRRSAEAAEAALATYQAEAVASGPIHVEPNVPATASAARPERVARPGAAGAGRRGVVGVVLDARGDEITVKPRRGATARVAVAPSTLIRRRGQRIQVADLRPRDRVVAVGRPSQSPRTLQASIVVVDPPRQSRAAR
jgi:hypothetical protein